MTLKEEIITEIEKVLVGKNEVVEKVLMAIYAGGHILLEDVPGTGKTTLALAFSKVLDLDYNRIQFHPDTMPSDITGFSIFRPETGNIEFMPGAVFCNLLLGDEINRTSPRTQAALLEAMSEKTVTIDGKTYPLPEPFICIATQNPGEMAGTQELPESQLDRFMIRLKMGYPSTKQQMRMIRNREKYSISSVKTVLQKEDLLEMQKAVCNIRISTEVMEYMVTLCEETRQHPMVRLGVSPRGVIALADMCKACAMLRQREFVIPEDVKEVFVTVCAHRLVLTMNAKIDHITAEDILKDILKKIAPPRRDRGPGKRRCSERI